MTPWDRPLWFDKTGAPISSDEWARLKHEDPEYYRVAADQVGDVWVSTVWLGIDHGFRRGGPPVIFETMTFSDRPWWDSVLMGRYATEEQALAGHLLACAQVGWQAPDDVQTPADPVGLTDAVTAVITPSAD